MFQIDDCIVYNSSGVYRIVDITMGTDIDGNETQYYVLQPVYGNNLTIKTPVNNPKISMRPVITKQEVLSLIDSMPNCEVVWIENDRERNERFKAALKSGDSEKWLTLVKSIYMEKQEKKNSGKKLRKADEDIMKSAEKNINEEFALALNISPDEVMDYIHDRLSNKSKSKTGKASEALC